MGDVGYARRKPRWYCGTYRRTVRSRGVCECVKLICISLDQCIYSSINALSVTMSVIQACSGRLREPAAQPKLRRGVPSPLDSRPYQATGRAGGCFSLSFSSGTAWQCQGPGIERAP